MQRQFVYLNMGVLLFSVLLWGCTPAYLIEPVSTIEYPSSHEVDIISAEPTRVYEVIARFQGGERSGCPESNPFCTLQEQARHYGASAIWIQERSVYQHPDEWRQINNQWMTIRHPRIEKVRGVFVRYLEE